LIMDAGKIEMRRRLTSPMNPPDQPIQFLNSPALLAIF